jgi:hypothetical protein
MGEELYYCKKCGQIHDRNLRVCPTKPKQVTPTVTKPVTQLVTEKPVTGKVTRCPVTKPVTGDRCPTCGQRVRRYQSNADKQRAYRQRKNGKTPSADSEWE